jgi:hypothetical protein
MGYSIGELFLYASIAGAILFLVTLAFVTIEEQVRRR